MRKEAGLVDGPSLYMCDSKGRAGVAEDETLLSCAADSRLTFRLNISPAKKFFDHYILLKSENHS
jgi:hypothetical protein